MREIYTYNEEGYYTGSVVKQPGLNYKNYTEEKPDFETNSRERFLAKFNIEDNVWEYEVKPEILEEEKEEQEKIEAKKRQIEAKIKRQLEEATKEETKSLVFEGSSDNSHLFL